jgi:uncharacterized protein (TIGR02996 family)
MATEAELLDAVCAAPDLDAPRLAYARWLDERSDPRGEFIRASCTPGGEARAHEFFSLHGDRWTRELRELRDEQAYPPRFARGFIAEVYLMGTFDELMLDFAGTLVAMRPVPVAVILGAERFLLRSDQRVYAWQRRADNAITIATWPDYRELASAPPTSENVEMLGFVGDVMRYRIGTGLGELAFSTG